MKTYALLKDIWQYLPKVVFDTYRRTWRTSKSLGSRFSSLSRGATSTRRSRRSIFTLRGKIMKVSFMFMSSHLVSLLLVFKTSFLKYGIESSISRKESLISRPRKEVTVYANVFSLFSRKRVEKRAGSDNIKEIYIIPNKLVECQKQ